MQQTVRHEVLKRIWKLFKKNFIPKNIVLFLNTIPGYIEAGKRSKKRFDTGQ